MELLTYYLLIHMAEAFTWGEYVSNLFQSKKGKFPRLFALFIIYIGLFLIFQMDIVWLNIICIFLGNVAYIYWGYYTKWYIALFHSGIATALMGICELISYPFILRHTNDVNFPSIMVIWAVLSKTMYASFLVLFSHTLHEKDHRTRNTDNIIFSLICIPIISSVIMYILYMITTAYPINRLHGRLISVGTMLLLPLNLLTIYIYIHSKKRNEIFTEMQLLLQKEQDLSEYYQILLKQNENQRILIHDIKNHLLSIAALNDQHEREQIANYLRQLTQSPALSYGVRICDNKLLNLVLHQYRLQCEEKSIRLAPDIRSKTVDFMETKDITSLFCNLLDNAVESAEKMDEGFIELKIDKQDATPFIKIILINSCRISPFSKDGRKLLSHKKDPLHHGYGMKSIGRVVEKYHGELKTYYDSDNTSFHTIILLKNPAKTYT